MRPDSTSWTCVTMPHDSGRAVLQLPNCRCNGWRGSCWASVEVRPRKATRTSLRNSAVGIPDGETA